MAKRITPDMMAFGAHGAQNAGDKVSHPFPTKNTNPPNHPPTHTHSTQVTTSRDQILPSPTPLPKKWPSDALVPPAGGIARGGGGASKVGGVKVWELLQREGWCIDPHCHFGAGQRSFRAGSEIMGDCGCGFQTGPLSCTMHTPLCCATVLVLLGLGAALECDMAAPSTPFESETCIAECAECFSGPQWADLKAEVGITPEIRLQRLREAPEGITVAYMDWPSAFMLGHVMDILLHEMMGYKTVPRVDADPRNVLRCVAAKRVHFVPEFWYLDSRSAADGIDPRADLETSAVGVVAKSGIFVPDYVVEENFCLSSYKAYRLPFLEFVAPDGTANCTLTLADAARGRCTGDDEHNCMTPRAWGGAVACDKGRFVPPPCRTPDGAYSRHCGEALMGLPSWSTSWWEAVVLNHRMNLTLVYLGNQLNAEVRRRAAAKQKMIFYAWEPDLLFASVEATRIQFPGYSQDCQDRYNQNPYKSGVDCLEPDEPLTKLLALGAPADVALFWGSVSLKNAHVLDLMRARARGRGARGSRAASCAWLQNNTALWTRWIRNTRARAPFPFWAFIPVAAVLLCGIVVAVLVKLYKRRTREKRELESAPSDLVAVMFTDIQGSTALWDSVPDAMATGLEIHNATIRSSIARHSGYEIKTIGDAFMVAFQHAEVAVLCACDIQTALVAAAWPRAFLGLENTAHEHERGPDGGPLLWNGLRVRVGINAGTPLREFVPGLGRVDYMGPPVNLAARVESKAAGGQILCTSAVMNHLGASREAVLKHLVSTSLGLHSLKGIHDKEELHSLVPRSLQGRRFPPVNEDHKCPTCLALLHCPVCDDVSGQRSPVRGRVSKTAKVRPADPQAPATTNRPALCPVCPMHVAEA